MLIHSRPVNEVRDVAPSNRSRYILAIVDVIGSDTVDRLADPTAKGVIGVAGNGGAVRRSNQLAGAVPGVTPRPRRQSVSMAVVGVRGAPCRRHDVASGDRVQPRGISEPVTGGIVGEYLPPALFVYLSKPTAYE